MFSSTGTRAESGSGRAKLGDEIVEVKTWDVLRVPAETVRAFEAGPEGLELVAFGAGAPGEAEMIPDWWSD